MYKGQNHAQSLGILPIPLVAAINDHTEAPTMASGYTAPIRKDSDTEYLVDCPEILGRISIGTTIEESKKSTPRR